MVDELVKRLQQLLENVKNTKEELTSCQSNLDKAQTSYDVYVQEARKVRQELDKELNALTGAVDPRVTLSQ